VLLPEPTSADSRFQFSDFIRCRIPTIVTRFLRRD
jgi:hypothetical protein